MSEPESPSISTDLNIIDLKKTRLPSLYLALPPQFINHVGSIVIAWGMFENSFQEFLGAMIAANGARHPGWQYFKFEQKHDIFGQEVARSFSENAGVRDGLARILQDSLPLQIRRNLLAHGRIQLVVSNAGPGLVARGRYKKQDLVETFTTETISDLYYDTLHLGGRMREFVSPAGQSFPTFSSNDRSSLLAFLEKNLLAPSIQSMLLPLPRPPQA
jgi:hypothetical protein